MDDRQRSRMPIVDTHPAVRISLIALIEFDPSLGGIGQPHNGREAMEVIASQLEPFLNALSQQDRHGSALGVRATLAMLHWQSGPRERAVATLQPASMLDTLERFVRASGEAGPALIPLPREPAAPGMIPERSGRVAAAVPEAAPRTSTAAATQRAAPIEPLSERELEVLRLLAEGLSNKDLATQLFLSVGTVKQHLHHIYGKLGTTSRTSALARARHFGIL